MENIQLKELLQSVAGIEDKEERDNTFRVVKGILTDKSIREEYVRMSEDEEYRDRKISEGSDILKSVLETFGKLEERKREDTMWTPGKDLLEVTNRKLRALYEFIYEDRVGGLVEEGFVKGNEWVVDGNVYLRETQRVARRVWERMGRR